MKSIISTYTAGGTSLAAGANVPLGTTTHRCGKVAQSGDGIRITSTGYYDVDALVGFVPTAANNVTVSMLVDGVAIAKNTISATAGANIVVPISTAIKISCCDSAVVTFVVDQAGTTAATSVTVTSL